MYGIYANIGGILMVNVTIYSIHGSYGYQNAWENVLVTNHKLGTLLRRNLGTMTHHPSGSVAPWLGSGQPS